MTESEKKAIKDAQLKLKRILCAIDKIEHDTLQLIGMTTLIDALAQEQAQYPSRGSANVFREFVLRHQKQCEYLEQVEPVTLLYRAEMPLERCIHILGLSKQYQMDEWNNVPVKSIIDNGKAEIIKRYIAENKENGEDFIRRKSKDHQLVNLLYRLRCKAVHEMGILGKTFGNPKIERPKEPYYRQINRNIGGQEKNSDSLTVPAVKLVIPNGFVRSILVDCIEGYLADCVQNNRFPFSNNSMKRKLYLSWYDT